jgi:hypothetical protein
MQHIRAIACRSTSPRPGSMHLCQGVAGSLLAMLLFASPAMAAAPSAFAPLADAIRRFKDDTAHQTGTAVVVVKDHPFCMKACSFTPRFQGVSELRCTTGRSV